MHDSPITVLAGGVGGARFLQGVVEVVPVIGPLAAAVVAIAVGLSVSTHLAVLAAIVVVGVRLLEDYVVLPRVLGHSVGLSPLVVLVSVTTVLFPAKDLE